MRKLVILLAACGALAACGVKPGFVDAPEGGENSGFPHTYPDLRNDPPQETNE